MDSQKDSEKNQTFNITCREPETLIDILPLAEILDFSYFIKEKHPEIYQRFKETRCREAQGNSNEKKSENTRSTNQKRENYFVLPTDY